MQDTRVPREESKIHEDANNYDRDLDRPRLKFQRDRILSYMLQSAGWKSLREISSYLEQVYRPSIFLESSVGGQLRNLRLPPYNFQVLKRRRPGLPAMGGLWEYKILPNVPSGSAAAE